MKVQRMGTKGIILECQQRDGALYTKHAPKM